MKKVKYFVLILLALVVGLKAPDLFNSWYYLDDRKTLILENRDHSRSIIGQYEQLPFVRGLPSLEEKALLFSLMQLEANPEGVSQLEMIYQAHDLPLLHFPSDGGPFKGQWDLSLLYDEYQQRLESIGENAKHYPREDLLKTKLQVKEKGEGKEWVALQEILVTSDFQMRDEESPLHLYPVKPYFPTSYYPASPHVPYIVDDAIKTMRAFAKVEGLDIDLAIYTGDLTDNGHYNEVRWGIDVLDGNLVNPDSGADDDIFPGKYANGEPNDTSDAFNAAGIEKGGKPIPWYFVHGNHDGLAMGVFLMTYKPIDLLFEKLEAGTFGLMNAISVGSHNYLGVIPNLRSMVEHFMQPNHLKTLVADGDRRLLNPTQIAQEMFYTIGSPLGHGMQYVKDINKDRSYSFLGKNKLIRYVMLDTTTTNLQGSLPEEKMTWIRQELEAAEAKNQFVIVSSHHKPRDIYDNGEGLIELLNEYPNVVAHLVAHWHRNEIKERPGLGSEHGYWQIETGSMVNWPQQLRILDLSLDIENGLGVITSTMLNHRSDNPFAVSERGRFLAYLEGYFHGGDEKLISREGKAKDRNTHLYFKVSEKMQAHLQEVL